MRIIIPLPEKTSLNAFYSATHWIKRKKIADAYHEAVWFAVKKSRVKPVEKYPVFILYHFTFKGKLLDASNCPVKLLEDGLVKAGILKNDSPKFVRGFSVLGVVKGKENLVDIEIT